MIENSAMNFTNMTLFAPTDQAFEVMDRERLENLLSNDECVGVRHCSSRKYAEEFDSFVSIGFHFYRDCKFVSV